MSDFLQLSRNLVRESGTVSNFGSQPAAVTSQVGRNAKMVEWTKNAWCEIQAMHESWIFRRKGFTSSLIVSIGEYTAASFSIADHYKWVGGRRESDVFTIYDPSVGVSDETALRFMPWAAFKRLYRRGAQVDARPSAWSVDYEGNLCIGPAPNLAYVFTGEYVRDCQVLAANADEPICPPDFHMMIVWYALLYLVEHDEAAPIDRAAANRKYDTLARAMANSQLPPIERAGGRLA